MKGGIRLGAIRGVPVIADASVFVLVLLFGVAILVDLNTSGIATTSEARSAAAILGGVGVAASVLLHELSHSLVALRRSMSVAEIRLFMFGGYSVIGGEPTATDEAVIGAAGPAASFLLAGLGWLGTVAAGSGSVAGRTAWALMMVNLAIAVFNLLPGFPLDGARVLRGAVAARTRDRLGATRLVNRVGRATGWVTVVVGGALMVARNPAGVYALVAGWFLAQTALVAGRREELSVAFDGVTVRDVMRPTSQAVPADAAISTMLDLYAIGPDLRPQPVEQGGRVVGVVGQEDVDAVSPPRWASTRVAAVMSPIGPSDVVEASDPLESLLLRPAGRSGIAVVVDDGRVVGIVDGRSLGAVLNG